VTTSQLIDTNNISGLLQGAARSWLQQKGYSPVGPERLVDSNGKLLNMASVQRQYRLETSHLTGRGITSELRMDALIEAIIGLELEKIASVADVITYDPGCKDRGTSELHSWLTAVMVTDKEAMVPYIVMRHFIWQVKRKLIGRPVVYHLMPLIYGPQGTGKSTAIKTLLRPLARYTLDGKTVPEMTDARNFNTLSQNFICFIDEMGKSEQADVDSLKAIVTAEDINFRPLYTNANTTVAQNCTFIGASNKDTRNLIKDNTGMRRFYQIYCEDGAKNQANWDKISAVDALTIWRSVNENEDVPEIKEWQNDLDEHQEDIRMKSSLEEFIDEKGITPGVTKVPLKAIYAEYLRFCESTKMAPYTRPNFSQELQQAKFTKGRNEAGVYYLLDKAPSMMQDVTKVKGAIV